MPARYIIVDSKIMEMKPFSKSNYNTGHFWSRRPDNSYKKKYIPLWLKIIYYLINDDWKIHILNRSKIKSPQIEK